MSNNNNLVQNESEALRAELQRLREENASLKSRKTGILFLKISEKGALSVYGMGRFPVTLYKQQWLQLLGSKEDILTFIDKHDAELSVKPTKVFPTNTVTEDKILA